jgi:hypothetical protein
MTFFFGHHSLDLVSISRKSSEKLLKGLTLQAKSLESKQFPLYLLFSDLFFVLLIFGEPLKNNPTKIW